MRGRRLRIASVVVLLGLIAAIPASTQVLFGAEEDEVEGVNLPLLVLVNRMELTREQMEEIHGLLAGLLEERDALKLRRAELEQEMIAFNGTAEELDEILEAFRAETEEQVQAASQHAEDVIDRIKEILTLKQGEILAEFLPGFLGDRSAVFLPRVGVGGVLGQRGTGAASTLREEILGQLEERLGEYPEVLDRLQERFGDAASGEGFSGRMQRGGFGMALGGQAQGIRQGFGNRGQVGQALQSPGGTTHRGLDWIEQLVEVLELKLEAIE
jgi:hypothetical protein